MENRRKTIVINHRFQYQYSLLCAAVAVLLVNLFLIAKLAFPGDSPLHLSTLDAVTIGAVELALVASIWMFVLRSTHRIAGPIYAINKTCSQLGNGILSARVELRSTDMFQEEAAEINKNLDKLNQRFADVQTTLERLRSQNLSDESHAEILQSLAEQLGQFNTQSAEDLQ